MKTIRWADEIETEGVCREVAAVLSEGGLVCLPCGGRYRIVADFRNPEAVIALMQSKGRVHKKPALVFIHHENQLAEVAGELEPRALELGRAHWPGPLTIRVKPHPDLPGKVVKQLGGKKSRIGVRIPADPLLRSLVACVGRPLLVSSANREKKSGDSSPAQVRKTFAARVDVFVDRGDLTPEPSSTVIDVRDGEIVIERAGVISREMLEGSTP
jgi:L-threonylcarbamoyladenylate synthase